MTPVVGTTMLHGMWFACCSVCGITSPPCTKSAAAWCAIGHASTHHRTI